jgi:hypothetical protein
VTLFDAWAKGPFRRDLLAAWGTVADVRTRTISFLRVEICLKSEREFYSQ